MPTIQVGPDSTQELQNIANTLGKSRKVVVVTGAGISTNCGLPDFRSEAGLYSLIQAQYDAALKEPPWEHSNHFEIDDRPKKKRKQWFYEVVAADGTVVDVIDEDATRSEDLPATLQPRSSSQSRSSDTTNQTSRSSTPGVKSSDESSLSSCPSLLSDPTWPETLDSKSASQPNLFCPPHIEDNFLQKHEIVLDQSLRGRQSTRSSPPRVDEESITALPPTSSLVTKDEPFRINSPRQKRTLLPSPVLEARNISFLPSREDETSASRPIKLQRADSSIISSTTEQEEPSATQSSQSSSRALPNLKGRDLFDCMVWNNPFTTSIFYMFISSLRQKVQAVEKTSETHKFIRILRDGGRLVRTYTQNIDLLESREGLSTDLSLGPGNRGRFSYRVQKERLPDIIDRSSAFYRGVECVLLHGSLVALRCGLCSKLSDWDAAERQAATLAGTAPDCPECCAYNSRRTSANRRGLAIGRLRPNIVLYGEEHPNANLISPLITHDLSLGPDVLLIMGTSLRVHGFKIMVKEFAKAVHNKGGKVIFVNNTKPSESVWGDVIDYWVAWDCDKWVLDLKGRRKDIWQPQGTSEVEVVTQKRDSLCTTKLSKKRNRPQCLRDDRMNGAYATFKILDSLRSVFDSDGKPSSRSLYWPPNTRQSNVLAVEILLKEKPQPPKTLQTVPRTKSKAPKAKSKNEPKVVSKKRKSHPTYDRSYLDNKENLTYKIAETWARMRKENPSLPPAPPELKIPFSNLVGNMPEFFRTSFAFDGKSNYLPNIGGTSSLAGMNIKSLPPSGIIRKAIKPSKTVPLANHAYGTRSRKLPEPGKFGGEKHRTPPPLPSLTSPETIVVHNPMTPSSRRIKRISSIGNVVSSPEDGIWHDASEVMT